MFKCEYENHQIGPNEKQHKKVIETRRKEYYNDQGQYVGNGYEIVKEISICDACKTVKEEI